jgi:hypothetical protein
VTPAAASLPGVKLVQRAHPRVMLITRWRIHDTFGNVASSEEEFERALAMGRCVMYIDSEGPMDTMTSRPKLAQFARVWNDAGNSPEVFFVSLQLIYPYDGSFYRTSQAWMDSQGLPPGGMKTHGRAGLLVWTQNGRVRNCRWVVGEFSQDELLDLTRRAFSHDRPNAPRQ